MSNTNPTPDSSPAPERQHGRRRLLLLLGPLAVLLAAGFYYLTSGRYVSTDDAYVKADKVAVSAQVNGEIASVAVAENQPVKAGQVLFRIDPAPFRLALDRADAKLRSVRADIEGLKASYQQKQAELQLAMADRDFAKRELERQVGLARRKLISQSVLDAAHHQLDTAAQQVNVLRQALAQLSAQLADNPAIPVEQHPKYQEAAAARDQAVLDLDHTVVRAPFDGVTSHTPQPGQYVSPAQPVMSIVASRDAWIEANFKETDLTYVQPGQAVTIRVDTYPDRTWHGTVKSLSQATGAEFSVLPPQNATGNWVKVVQRIPVRIAVQASADMPALRVGMSTQVEIDTGHHRHIPGWAQPVLAWLSDATPAANAMNRN